MVFFVLPVFSYDGFNTGEGTAWSLFQSVREGTAVHRAPEALYFLLLKILHPNNSTISLFTLSFIPFIEKVVGKPEETLVALLLLEKMGDETD